MIRLRGISRSFGQTDAVIDANLNLYPGEIHALVGENGAGKSTIMHMLAGITLPDSGTMHLDDVQIRPSTPREALGHGIGMVTQHPALYPELTCRQNIELGTAGLCRGTGRRELHDAAKRLMNKYDIDIDIDRKAGRLTETEREFVALVSLRLLPLRYIILDEPTATFSTPDEERYYRMVSDAVESGLGIVLITHKIREVSHIAHRVTVMRKGRCVHSGPVTGRSDTELRTLLFGTEHEVRTEDRAERRGFTERSRGPAIALKHITSIDNAALLLDEVDLSVYPGEIAAVVGIRELGPEQIEAVCTGAVAPTSGTIAINGETIDRPTPGALRTRGLGILPADRNGTAVSMDSSVRDNLVVARRRELHPRGIADQKGITAFIKERLESAAVRVDPSLPATGLSGGMLQRIVLAREIDSARCGLVISEPFRGLDVHGRTATVRALEEIAREGIAVLCFISDIDDLFAVADTAYVVRHGRIVKRLERPFRREAIEAAILGMEDPD